MTIKRYKNRKLYNMTLNRYTNLSEIETMILEGEDIQVICAESNEDITLRILKQVFLNNPTLAFPKEGVIQAIRGGGGGFKAGTYKIAERRDALTQKTLFIIFDKNNEMIGEVFDKDLAKELVYIWEDHDKIKEGRGCNV